MSGPVETRQRRIAATTDVLVVVVTVLNALSWLLGGFVSPAWFVVVVGLALAGRVTRDLFRPRGTAVGRVVSVAALAVEVLGGIVTASVSPLAGFVLPVHLLWAVVFVGAAVARPLLARSIRSGASLDAENDRRAREEQRIQDNRERELDHVARVERDKKWAARPSAPGELTGYEPSALADVELVSRAWMYGQPGVGLGAAGFDQHALERGQEGEVNFAKVLEQRGFLERFATFWSVHMPDEGVGASRQFQTDIDCVIVTGTSMWLVDVKNYSQGGVRWTVEHEDALGRSSAPTLVAIDLQTGGAVGQPRKMSANMKLAHERFEAKLRNIGVRTALKPVVVMMPREDGIGRIDDVVWPGSIPAAGLPDLLRWLEEEPDFVPTGEASTLLVPILSALLKDESGSAPAVGERRRPAATTTTAAPAPTRVVATVATGAGAAGEPAPTGGSADRVCASCGHVRGPEEKFCHECGAA